MSKMRRFAAYSALWRAIRNAHRPGSPSLRDRALALPRLARAAAQGRYDGTSKGRLALVALAAAYVLSPFDVVPEAPLLLLGLGDDAVVLAWLAGALLDETDRFLAWERRGARVVPGETVPGETVPGETVPGETVPGEPMR